MITKMKKLTFLVYHKEYEAFLAQIRELGVVHVVERQCGEMDDTLQQFMQKRTLYKNMLQSMHTLADKQPEEKVHKELSADALVKFYEDLQARIQDLNQQIPAIDKDVAQMEVWGDFDWRAIRKLEDAGWFVQFYTCPEKDYNEAWAEDYNAIVVKENGGHLYFVTVTPQPVELDVEPLRLPSLSLSELSRKKADTEEALVQAHAGLKEFCKANYCTLEKYNLQLQEEIDLLKVKLNSEKQRLYTHVRSAYQNVRYARICRVRPDTDTCAILLALLCFLYGRCGLRSGTDCTRVHFEKEDVQVHERHDEPGDYVGYIYVRHRCHIGNLLRCKPL